MLHLLLAAALSAATPYDAAIELLEPDAVPPVALTAFRQIADPAVAVDWGVDPANGLDELLPWVAPMNRLFDADAADFARLLDAGDLAAAADAVVAHAVAAGHVGSAPLIMTERLEADRLSEALDLRTRLMPHLTNEAAHDLRRRLADLPDPLPTAEAARRESAGFIAYLRATDGYPFAELVTLDGESLDRWDYRIQWADRDRRAGLIAELERVDELAVAALREPSKEAAAAWTAAAAESDWLARRFGLKLPALADVQMRQRLGRLFLAEPRHPTLPPASQPRAAD